MSRNGCLVALAFVLGVPSHASGSPSDPLSVDAPSFDSPRPEPVSHELGDYSVNDKNGAVSFTAPIHVPPGRQGMAPSLALTYSSQAPFHGGVAAQWSIEVPVIQWDPKIERFVVSMGPTSGALVPVDDKSLLDGVPYRVERDDGGVRFEHFGKAGGWGAFTSDGVFHHFRLTDGYRWILTSETDRFGNRVEYNHAAYLDPTTGVPFSYMLDSIEYTSNERAGLGPHAMVEFEYDQVVKTCPGSIVPIGARLDYSVASPEVPTPYLDGSHKLIAIHTFVRDDQLMRTPWREVRRLSLGYDESKERCDGPESPRRVLVSLQETSWSPDGAQAEYPAVTFEYLQPDTQFSGVRVVPGGWGNAGTRNQAGGQLLRTMMDLDGDGAQDVVRMQQIGATCKLAAELGPITESPGGAVFEVPLAPWRDGEEPADDEFCTLSAQYTWRQNVETEAGCIQDTLNENGFYWQDWDGDGRTDLITAILADQQFYDPNLDGKLENGDIPTCRLSRMSRLVRPADPMDPGPSDPCSWGNRMRLQQVCDPGPETRYAWRVYRNTGAEFVFVQTVWVPIPILPDGRRANLGHGRASVASPTHAMVDLNGDRRLDLVWASGHEKGCPEPKDSDPVQYWAVYFGRYDGAVSAFDDAPFCWPVPNSPTDVHAIPKNTVPDTTIEADFHSLNTSNLIDVNGDGLSDLVTRRTTNPELTAYMSYGSGFLPMGRRLSADPALAITNAERTRVHQWNRTLEGYFLDGERQSLERLIDIDGDGRTDLLRVALTGEAEVRFNVGDVLLPPVALSGDWSRALRYTRNLSFQWRVETDAIDATGDGRPDHVTWTGTNVSVRHQDHPDGRPGLLSRIDNGRGGTTQFKYASTLNRSVVAPDERAWELPQVMWVARQMIVSPAPGASQSITDYRYAGPVYGPESGRPSDPSRFLGFEHTTTDLPQPAGAFGRGRIEKRYEYKFGGALQDWRGRLVETWAYGRDTAGALRLVTYTKTDHAIEPLFDGQVTFVHTTGSETHTCGAGESSTACMTSGTNALYQIETWVPWPDAVVPKLYLQEEVEQRQASPTAPLTRGDRKTISAPEIWYTNPLSPALYFIAPQLEETYEAISDETGVRWAQTGLTVTTNDPVYALPIQVDVYFDPGTVASTVIEFDTRTGNPTRVIKPVQWETSRAATSYEYDDHELFVARTINELNHAVDQNTDVGTGAVVRTLGPNSKPVAGGVAREETRIAIDGFGRTLERYVSVDDPVAGYVLQLAEWNAYEDHAIPNVITHGRLVTFGAPPGVTTITTLDGLGRPSSVTKRRYIAWPPGAPNEVVRYEYDRAGNLALLHTPDPRVDTGAAVTTSFEYDALSRPVRLVRPDGTSIRRDYDGFTQTIIEETTDGSGSTTVATYDRFGLLERIDELDGADTATTTYRYDGEGNLVEVMDADGNLTTIAWDWAGHRTSIVRGDRVWQYFWDLNGNLELEIPPLPVGVTDPGAYTKRYVQDDLDRVTQVIPATMGRTLDRQAKLGIGTIVYSYDGTEGPRRTRLADCPRSRTSSTIRRPRRSSGSRQSIPTWRAAWLPRSCGASMRPTSTRSRRRSGSPASTTRSIPRGRPRSTTARRGRSPTTRAGSRRASTGTTRSPRPTGTSPRSRTRWPDKCARVSPRSPGDSASARATAFDILGRPDVDEIHDLTPFTLRSRRDYSFNQTGDVVSLDVVAPSVSGAFAFTYDPRHRLRGATGPLGYSGAWTYSSGGNVLSASVAGPIHPRNVTYQYGAIDPQAVDALRHPDGSAYATFAYDRAGNMIARTVPEGAWSLEWDNEDQLREAVGPSGTEAYWYDHTGSRIVALSATGSRIWFAESELNIDANGGEKRWIHVAGLARVENGTTIELQYADHLASTSLALDSSGVPTVSYVYAPWGEVLTSSGATGTHCRRFNGKENDERTGLNYYGFRYYDPLIQRWISSDPLYRFDPEIGIGSPLNQNLYGFSGNNPVRYLDPDGRAGEAVLGEVMKACGTSGSCAAVVAGVIGTIGTVGVALTVPAVALVAADTYANPMRASGAGCDDGGATCRTMMGIELRHEQAVNDQAALNKFNKSNADIAKGHDEDNDFKPATRDVKVKNIPMEAKKVPNPHGKKGGEAHQAEVKNVEAKVKAKGLDAVKELKVDTPGGEKKKRYVDVAGVDPATGATKEIASSRETDQQGTAGLTRKERDQRHQGRYRH